MNYSCCICNLGCLAIIHAVSGSFVFNYYNEAPKLLNTIHALWMSETMLTWCSNYAVWLTPLLICRIIYILRLV